MRQINSNLFSTRELQELVRRMIIRNQVKNYTLTDTHGGITLRWETELSEDRRAIFCKLVGPGWTLHATMGQDAAAFLTFEDELFLDGDAKRFETDIIYLKIVLAS